MEESTPRGDPLILAADRQAEEKLEQAHAGSERSGEVLREFRGALSTLKVIWERNHFRETAHEIMKSSPWRYGGDR